MQVNSLQPASGQEQRSNLRDILDGLSTQLRVIRALILRETMTRYGEHKLGFLWAFVEPILMVLIISLIFQFIRNTQPGGMPVIPFLITGFVPFAIFRDTMSQTQSAISQNAMLVGFPQVSTFDVIVARALLELAVLLSVLTIMLWGTGIFGFEVRCEKPLQLLAACLMLCMTALGFGFIFASLSPLIPSIRQLSAQVLGRPLFLASGVIFVVERFPPKIRDIVLYNPLLHMIELVRSSYFYEFESSHASWTYAGSWAFGILAFGMLVHQVMHKRAMVGL
ncbi:MAG: ABC transporter permease [Granulosicoccus sp.]|nr:ABC transporter permease [Granulosicoccus sp.]